MCLKIKSQLLEAKEDITVYKLLERIILSPEKFRSFYRCVPVELEKSYESGLEVDTYNNEIDEGIHSMANLKGAIELLELESVYSSWSGVIVECIIPKGAHYYNGTFSNFPGCIASDTITYSNKVVYTKKNN